MGLNFRLDFIFILLGFVLVLGFKLLEESYFIRGVEISFNVRF